MFTNVQRHVLCPTFISLATELWIVSRQLIMRLHRRHDSIGQILSMFSFQISSQIHRKSSWACQQLNSQFHTIRDEWKRRRLRRTDRQTGRH